MKLLLIDGNSLLFRGFYATYKSLLSDSEGNYTNAVYGFANMLFKALKLIKPTHCAVCLDKGKHTFRHDLASDYKGTRKATPPELIPQFALVRNFLKAINIPYFELDDIEADDLVGSLAKKYDDVETVILTGDRDLLQLIDKKTVVYRTLKGISDIEKVDEEVLYAEYNLLPLQIIDLKGLMGDKSDNIKGVKGVGEKTAIKLLKDYQSCENIYVHIEDFNGKLKENLLAGKEDCFLSKRLATIKTDVELDVEISDLTLNLNWQTGNDFFKQHSMFSLINKNYKGKETINYQIVNKISESLLKENTFIYFLGAPFSYYERSLLGLVFAGKERIEFIALASLLLDKDALIYLASENIKKITYDYKASRHAANYNGFKFKYSDDLMLSGFLVNNNNIDFLHLANYYHEDFVLVEKDIFGTPKKPINDKNKQIEYGCSLAKIGLHIFSKTIDDLKDNNLLSLYEDIELPCSDVLYKMEKTGICCDDKVLDSIAKESESAIETLEQDIYKIVGHRFNINSFKQLSDVLFKELNLPDYKKGSTASDVLSNLEDKNPIISLIMAYRKFSKLYSVYALGLQKYIQKDGRIHTIFLATGTQTGRLSSSDPNMQNIVARDEDCRQIRKAFVAKKGYVFLDSDYSQIELRVLASLAKENKMIEAFRNNVDIHTQTAIDIFKIESDDVTPQLRRQAKAINFGIVYGISDFGLAKQVGISFKEAQRFIDNYYKTYPAIINFLKQQVNMCQEKGYVETLFLRRRYIDTINSKQFALRQASARAAMNAAIQGSAADLIKKAMISCVKKIEEKGLKSRLLLQIHDELLFEVAEDEIEIMHSIVLDSMNSAADLSSGLASSYAIGKDYWSVK